MKFYQLAKLYGPRDVHEANLLSIWFQATQEMLIGIWKYSKRMSKLNILLVEKIILNAPRKREQEANPKF